jgi:hydroxyacylglutathione hydrolase
MTRLNHSVVHVETFFEPTFGENAYVVDTGEGGACWIIDPGLPPSAQQIGAHISRRRLRPDAIVLTHAHADHIAGVPEVLGEFPELPVFVARDERRLLGDPKANLSALGGIVFGCNPPDLRDLEPPGPMRLGDTVWDVADVSGHSPGGRSLYCAAAGVVIVGDALFEGSIGRTDFPGSHHDRLIRNIRTNLFSLPDETVVYSGHGPPTTIGREKQFNPFLS